jgi:hypothetical protein
MVGTVQHQLFQEHLQHTQVGVEVRFKFLLVVLQQAQEELAAVVTALEEPGQISMEATEQIILEVVVEVEQVIYQTLVETVVQVSLSSRFQKPVLQPSLAV